MLEMYAAQIGTLGWEDFPRGVHGSPLQYSCLENPMNREAWQITVHRVTKSWIQSDLAHITDLYAENHPSTQFNPWS